MKKIFILLILANLTFTVFAQTTADNSKPRLGILPFTGGDGGDGETIATLLSFQSEIQGAFTVVPRTSAVNALVAEQNFQMAGYTDSDTVARIGRLLNADYVVSGHIRRLGDSNLIIATIVNVETFEQLAGDYREYRVIEEVRGLLPDISRRIIVATRRDTTRLPRLAIAPFNIARDDINVRDAETLAQILSVEITNTGKYAVLPRTETMQTALRELDFQTAGHTAEDEAKALGRAINAEFVLSADVRSLGNINMFTAQILNVEDGSLLYGDMREYRVIDDGINLIPELALLLTDRAGAAVQIAARQREQARAASRAATFEDPSKFWSIGISIGSSFTDPFLIGTLSGTIAPFRYMFIELGCDLGFISDIEGAGYYSVYPFVHAAIFVPFKSKGGWYIGTGGGLMIHEYTFDDIVKSEQIPAMDFLTGFNIGNVFDISYTLRTNFSSANHKVSVGYTYRFD